VCPGIGMSALNTTWVADLTFSGHEFCRRHTGVHSGVSLRGRFD
jgi:hypothetical protein